jgi:hypothetical protein
MMAARAAWAPDPLRALVAEELLDFRAPPGNREEHGTSDRLPGDQEPAVDTQKIPDRLSILGLTGRLCVTAEP